MTDWTTPEDVPADTVERLHRWLLQEGNPEDAATPGERAVADIIRTFWPVPPRTLAEGLRSIREWVDWEAHSGFDEIVARAEEIEQERDDARTEVEQAEDRAVEWQGIAQRDYAKVELLTADLAEARAEVEHLTAVNENLRKTDNYSEFREQFLTVQKGAESNAESLDPADVPAGEAWLVDFYGEKRNAVKDKEDPVPWDTVTAGGRLSPLRNTEIKLVSRLVPAPRVITNPDELDRLPHSSVILSADNDAWQKSSETSLWASAWWTTSDGEPSMWPSDCLCDEDHPATVLWELEA